MEYTSNWVYIFLGIMVLLCLGVVLMSYLDVKEKKKKQQEILDKIKRGEI